jgi:Icc-related predicted phosphoesterase
MRILSITEPIVEIPFLNAGKGAGGYYVDSLPVHDAIVDELPSGLDAIVATADLQGRETFDGKYAGPPRLLGEVLPSILANEVYPLFDQPFERTAALLAGDFYTVPNLDKRGGSGDVTSVWNAFGERFDWVAGVAGNHDTFGSERDDIPQFPSFMHYLDNHRVELDGMKIAGLGGIVGNPKRLQRKTEEQYLEQLADVIGEPTDVLIMHDGPNAPEQRFRGNSQVRWLIEEMKPSLVVRGHAHWAQPLVQLTPDVPVLNVDARCVIMRTDSPNS